MCGFIASPARYPSQVWQKAVSSHRSQLRPHIVCVPQTTHIVRIPQTSVHGLPTCQGCTGVLPMSRESANCLDLRSSSSNAAANKG